jgi:ribosomal 50S subunit-recycling heat shock protein
MRIDKFLKVCFLVKRRTIANEVASDGVVYVNGRKVKPSYDVKAGDLIKLDLWNCEKTVKVLKVPTTSSIKKSLIEDYIEVVSYSPKSIDDVSFIEDTDELFK